MFSFFYLWLFFIFLMYLYFLIAGHHGAHRFQWRGARRCHVHMTDNERGKGPGDQGVERVAVRIVEGAPTDLRVEAMRFAASRTARAVTYDRPATPAGGPVVATRASWAPGGWQGTREGWAFASTVVVASGYCQ